MYELKECDNCNKSFTDGDLVTVVVPNVKVEGKYRRGYEGFRLNLSTDAIELRASKIYCKDCLDVDGHILSIKEDDNA